MFSEWNTDIITAPNDFVLTQICDCSGKWETRTLRKFRELFPLAYKEYVTLCIDNTAMDLLGRFILVPADNKRLVGLLFVANTFGSSTMTFEVIKQIAVKSLQDISLNNMGLTKFASTDFDLTMSGHQWFNLTEVLSEFTEKYGLNWRVYAE